MLGMDKIDARRHDHAKFSIANCRCLVRFGRSVAGALRATLAGQVLERTAAAFSASTTPPLLAGLPVVGVTTAVHDSAIVFSLSAKSEL